jgi:hypothetical protein
MGEDVKRRYENVKEDATDLLDKGKSKIYEAKNDLNSSTI